MNFINKVTEIYNSQELPQVNFYFSNIPVMYGMFGMFGES